MNDIKILVKLYIECLKDDPDKYKVVFLKKISENFKEEANASYIEGKYLNSGKRHWYQGKLRQEFKLHSDKYLNSYFNDVLEIFENNLFKLMLTSLNHKQTKHSFSTIHKEINRVFRLLPVECLEQNFKLALEFTKMKSLFERLITEEQPITEKQFILTLRRSAYDKAKDYFPHKAGPLDITIHTLKIFLPNTDFDPETFKKDLTRRKSVKITQNQ